MKKKSVITLIFICCMAVCYAFANGLTGTWIGSFKMPDGNEVPLTYEFKADSSRITGTVKTPQGDLPIEAGKLNATDISFSVSVNGAEVKNVGKYYANGDSVTLVTDFMGSKIYSTLKRESK